MRRYLLLGAGFSRNWGGWLASEVCDDLVWRLKEYPAICSLILEQGFEPAFFDLYEQFRRPDGNRLLPQILAFQTALWEAFGAMNASFTRRPSLELSQDRQFSILDFLSRFDAIFTLNQDMLLELHYHGIELAGQRRWQGVQWPGCVVPPEFRAITRATIGGLPRQRWIVGQAEEQLQIEAHLQPIIKLHGSAHWYEGPENDRAPVIVIGGNKLEAIERNPLLASYGRYFSESLTQADSLLMTIGYSFNDDHINDAICDAQEANAEFGLFVVDPAGRRLLTKRVAGEPRRIEQVRYLGGSSRPLSETFKGDELEWTKLMRFFE